MTVVAIECASEIPVGKVVVIDDTSLLAREYDVKTDTIDDVVGVSFPKTLTSYRNTSFIDGPILVDKYDLYSTNEQLQYDIVDNAYVSNPNYDGGYDPQSDTSTCYVRLKGFCPVDKGQLLPSSWKKVKNGTDYDFYII